MWLPRLGWSGGMPERLKWWPRPPAPPAVLLRLTAAFLHIASRNLPAAQGYSVSEPPTDNCQFYQKHSPKEL